MSSLSATHMSIYNCLISESRRLWDYSVQPLGFTEQEACSEPPQTFYFLSRVVFLLLTPLSVGGHSRQLCSVCRGFVCFLQISDPSGSSVSMALRFSRIGLFTALGGKHSALGGGAVLSAISYLTPFLVSLNISSNS